MEGESSGNDDDRVGIENLNQNSGSDEGERIEDFDLVEARPMDDSEKASDRKSSQDSKSEDARSGPIGSTQADGASEA